MAKAIRVGIIGASAEGGWAREGHVPAVQALDGLEFAAVATNSQKTADAAAQAFGVPAAYGNGMDLIRAPGIDLVTVATRVPDHRELVLAALAAGKHVYSEWPLGAGMGETEEMAAAASTAGVHTAIGLQLRGSPVVRRARELIVSGAVGRVLGASVYSATAGFGPDVPAPYLYLEAPESFANLITIQGAHTVDLVITVVGALEDLSALATAQYPEIRAGDAGERRPRTTFDHLLLQSRLMKGGTLSVEVAGGRPPETPFRLEVTGEAGTLRLDGGAARGFQSGRLRLSLDGAPQRVDEGELAAIPDAAANVAGVYAALRDDIARGTFTVAGFGNAVKLTQLVTDLLSSSRAGSRAKAADWPEQ
jgi:predicted dehydrogenase